MSGSLSDHYADLLTGSYDCVDRIVLNAYYRMGHDPGGFRLWWRALTGSDETLKNTHLMRLAGRFSRRIRGYAKANGIPVVDCSVGERKHDIAEEYLAMTKVTRAVSHSGRPCAGTGVGCQRQSSHRAKEADALCQPLLLSYPRFRLGPHHHQDQWASSVPRAGDSERP
jgi:hypothetical protein